MLHQCQWLVYLQICCERIDSHWQLSIAIQHCLKIGLFALALRMSESSETQKRVTMDFCELRDNDIYEQKKKRLVLDENPTRQVTHFATSILYIKADESIEVIKIGKNENLSKCRSILKRKKNSKKKIILFLHFLLSHKKYSSYIKWVDTNEKIFKIMQPKIIAYLWGCLKNNMSMNYVKFAKALRI